MIGRRTTMRLGGAALAVAILVAVAPADEEKSPSPRNLYLTGRYAESAEAYKAPAETDVAAAVGLARCQAATGDRDAAAATLKAAAERDPKAPAPLAELALLEFSRGDGEGARK